MTHAQVFKELDEALEEFGRYSYYDKGPDEVMDTSPMVIYLKTLSGVDAGKWLKGLCTHKHGERLRDHLAGYLDMMPEPWVDDMLKESGAEF